MLDLHNSPHRRLNALTGEWILVSPHRTKRPWRGQMETPAQTGLPTHDPNCYLCPGAIRANGVQNPRYADVFAFDNDFPALLTEGAREEIDEGGLLVARSEPGRCRVISFSPRHDLSLARMTMWDIARVIDVWREEFQTLGALDSVNYVQLFENRGFMMGASNPHPHCQIWATQSVPNEVEKEAQAQQDYLSKHGSCLLCDYLAREIVAKKRIICENDAFVALVPFWAAWPFETMVLSRRHFGAFDDFDAQDGEALADILKRLTVRYDNLFETPFPYTMGFHPRPTDGKAHPHWHFHGHFFPPLLRSATVRKFMVGFELLGSPQRDITPEDAAERLLATSETHHYLDRA